MDIILCYIRLKRKLVVTKKYYACRRTSNVEEVEEDLEAGIISVDNDADANVAHDEKVARAVALDENMASNTLVVTSAATAAVPSTSTSTTSSFRMKLNIHLQDTMQKFRATAASRRREEVTREMLSLIKDTNKQQTEEDDELDLSFASMAKRMRKNLNDKQREKVLSSIQKLVSTAIENAEVGLPVVPPPPNLFQPIHNRIPTPQNYGIPQGPPPPTATPVSNTTGGGDDFFQPGPPSLNLLQNF